MCPSVGSFVRLARRLCRASAIHEGFPALFDDYSMANCELPYQTHCSSLTLYHIIILQRTRSLRWFLRNDARKATNHRQQRTYQRSLPHQFHRRSGAVSSPPRGKSQHSSLKEVGFLNEFFRFAILVNLSLNESSTESNYLYGHLFWFSNHIHCYCVYC